MLFSYKKISNELKMEKDLELKFVAFFWCPYSSRMVETLSKCNLNWGKFFSRQNIFKHVFSEALCKCLLPRKGRFHRTFFWTEVLFSWTVFGGFSRSKNCHFNIFRGSEFWFTDMDFFTLWRLKLTNKSKFTVTRIAKQKNVVSRASRI